MVMEYKLNVEWRNYHMTIFNPLCMFTWVSMNPHSLIWLNTYLCLMATLFSKKKSKIQIHARQVSQVIQLHRMPVAFSQKICIQESFKAARWGVPATQTTLDKTSVNSCTFHSHRNWTTNDIVALPGLNHYPSFIRVP